MAHHGGRAAPLYHPPMTTVTMSFKMPGTGGLAPAAGYTLEWMPTRRRTAGTDTILPAQFTVTLDANGAASVTVAATGPDWAWLVSESIPGGGSRVVTVPSTTTIDYTALQDVDPATLTPPAAPPEAWWLALAKVQSITTGPTAPEHPAVGDIWFQT